MAEARARLSGEHPWVLSIPVEQFAEMIGALIRPRETRPARVRVSTLF